MHSFRSTPLVLASALVIMALAAPSAHATQWKWRDADGRVQYSDRPPPSYVAEKDILTRPRPSALVSAATANPPSSASAPTATLGRPAAKASDPELEAKKRKAEEEKENQRKSEEAQQAKSRAQDCERARGYQRSLDDGMRIARTNAKGEREVLDDQARAQETARNRQVIETSCK